VIEKEAVSGGEGEKWKEGRSGRKREFWGEDGRGGKVRSEGGEIGKR